MSETQTAREDQVMVDPAAKEVDHQKYRLTVNGIGLVYKTSSSERRSFTKDFIAHLPEAIQQEWDCHACREWYREFGGDVLVSYENGERKVVSAYFEPHQCPAPELADAFAFIARKAVSGKREGLRNTFDGPQCSGEAIGGGHVLGRMVAGGFSHFHAWFPETSNLPRIGQGTIRHRVDLVGNTVGTYARVGKYDVVAGRIKQAIALLDFDGRATDALRRAAATANALMCLLEQTMVKGLPVEYAYLTMEYGDQERLHHLNGSTVGKFLDEVVVREGNHEYAINNFVKQTDPELYQRAQREADDKAIAEFAKLVDKFPGCLDYRLLTAEETPYFLPIRTVAQTEEQGAEAEDRSASALLRARVKAHEVAKTKPQQRLSVNFNKPAQITIDSFIRTVLPNAERIEVNTRGHARFSFAFEVDPDHLSETSPLAWGNRFSLSTLVHPAMWSHVGLGDAAREAWTPLVGLAGSPWMEAETTNEKINWWVVEGNLEASAGGFLGTVKPPLFAPYYRGEFYPHRRSMETLMADSAVRAPAKPAILLPAGANMVVRVYTDSNVLAYYEITTNDHDAIRSAIEAYRAMGLEADA